MKTGSPLTFGRNKANYDKNCIMAFHQGKKTGYLPSGICSKLVRPQVQRDQISRPC